MTYSCPICQKEMTKEHKIKFIDYYCDPPQPDHHYSIRYVDTQVMKVKVRLTDVKHRDTLFFKIDYVEGNTQVWITPNDPKRTVIPQTFTPDFSQIDKLRAKIRTYLVFS